MIAQGFGIAAMTMNCLSYQQKNRRTVLLFQRIGSILFAVNFFMLDAFAGALLNAVMNAVMIPVWGACGAAAASLLTQIFTNFLLGFIYRFILFPYSAKT